VSNFFAGIADTLLEDRIISAKAGTKRASRQLSSFLGLRCLIRRFFVRPMVVEEYRMNRMCL
jgi:hypothetical protein